MAIEDLFRLLSGSELGLVLGIIGLSLQILTSELGSLVLCDAGHSGLSPAEHSGCWLTLKPGNDPSALSRFLGLGLSTDSRAAVGDPCLQDRSQIF